MKQKLVFVAVDALISKLEEKLEEAQVEEAKAYKDAKGFNVHGATNLVAAKAKTDALRAAVQIARDCAFEVWLDAAKVANS